MNIQSLTRCGSYLLGIADKWGKVARLAASAGMLLSVILNARAADSKPGLALEKIAEGFVSPTVLVSLGDNSGRLLVGDQIGIIYVLTKESSTLDKPFLNLTNRLSQLNAGFDERGLLGLALHPRLAQNRRFYVLYSAPLRPEGPSGWNCTLHLSEFKVLENNPAEADPASERVLLQIDKPYFNHNGGCIAFGPDGYLYVSIGDGGNANDEGLGHTPDLGNAQDLTNLLGKILRIDVNKGDPYAIPSDNPFTEGKGRPEIYAYGLRNAWRMSFDRGGAHDLFAGDIGQTMFEEVNIITKGGNYGWRVREGFHCFDPKRPNKPPQECPKTDATGRPLLDPIFEYKNVNGFRNDPEALGISVTGGYVYRGKAIPQLQGRYVFGDWSRNFVIRDGVLYVARPSSSESKKWSIEPLHLATHPQGRLRSFVLSLGEDAEGELYVLTNDSNGLIGKTGKVFKLVPHE